VRVDALCGLAHVDLRPIKPEVCELLQRGCRLADGAQQLVFRGVRAQPLSVVGGLLREDVGAEQGAEKEARISAKLSAAIRCG
jgi:hypothetical protein